MPAAGSLLVFQLPICRSVTSGDVPRLSILFRPVSDYPIVLNFEDFEDFGNFRGEFSDRACLIVVDCLRTGNLPRAQLGRSAVRITDCIYVYDCISVVLICQTRFLLPFLSSSVTFFYK